MYFNIVGGIQFFFTNPSLAVHFWIIGKHICPQSIFLKIQEVSSTVGIQNIR